MKQHKPQPHIPHISNDNIITDSLSLHLPDFSAYHLMTKQQRVIFYSLLAACCISLITLPNAALYSILIGTNIIYAINLLFKVALYCYGRVTPYPESLTLSDDELPIYTILVPLFEEQKTLPKLLQSLNALHYPKDKLDIKLIIEEDDTLTQDTLQQFLLAPHFHIVKVPYSLPRTKPKACNYALQFAKGKYVTIYDAEDMPEADQLRKAVSAFMQADEQTICVQSRLNYYNRKQNLLTGLFSLEYAVWFSYLLPGLAKLQTPIPLGGTSNHFSTEHLRELHCWDAYNVTEDADLGIRLARHGYNVGLIDSTTWEESPSTYGSWLRQRSRWVKGYIQTYIVHMRNPLLLFKQLGFKGFLTFQLFVGAPSFVYLTSPILWIGALLLYTIPSTHFPDWLYSVTTINLAIGYIVHIMLSLAVITHYRWWYLLPHTLCFPLYWMLHSLASFKALVQLCYKPHYWEKTEHGRGKDFTDNHF